MNRKWKFLVAALLAVVLALAVLAAGPVERTTFKLAHPEAEQACRLSVQLRGIDGVLGMRLEKEAGKLLVEHRPDVTPQQLAQFLSAHGHQVIPLGTRRILPIYIHAFPPGPSAGGRNLSQCSSGDSWRSLLDQWRRRSSQR